MHLFDCILLDCVFGMHWFGILVVGLVLVGGSVVVCSLLLGLSFELVYGWLVTMLLVVLFSFGYLVVADC